MREEIWIKMPEFNNEYEVSNTGKIRRCEHTVIIPSKELKIKDDEDVTIKNKTVSVGKMVAKYFKLPNPRSYKKVERIDDSKPPCLKNIKYVKQFTTPKKRVVKTFDEEVSSFNIKQTVEAMKLESQFWENL